MPDLSDLLRRAALFRDCTPEQLSAFLGAGTLRAVEEDSFFFQQGDPAGRLYVLAQGRAALTQVTPDGQQITLRILIPGQMFGALGLAETQAVYPAAAQALEDSQAMAWKVAEFRALAEGIPSMAFNVMGLMAAYIQEMQDRYRELATERVEQRLARALLRLAAQSSRRTDEGLLIEIALTRQDLAQMAGTTLYTVSRMLSEWERQGLIRSGRERIVVANPHGLVRIAEDLLH